MDFELPAETTQLLQSLRRWNGNRPDLVGRVETFDPQVWKEFLKWNILGADSGGTILDAAAWYMEVGRGGLPGPVLEADLALSTGNTDAVTALANGDVVSSVAPGPAGLSVVGWGSVAAIVVDQSNGATVARQSLEPVRAAYPLPHGWYRRTDAATSDPFTIRRWIMAAALTVGMARGALELTTRHVSTRVQFGKRLAEFQAVQFPLAECKILVEGASLAVLDAAWRQTERRPAADAAAAIAWLAAIRTSLMIEEHCHQAFGSLGLCNETGLVRFTWGMAWLRLSIGKKTAQRFLASHGQFSRETPSHRVLEAFRHDPDATRSAQLREAVAKE